MKLFVGEPIFEIVFPPVNVTRTTESVPYDET